uniref:Uncharacterized protein n=1 Tax=Panagrolaimus sp. ES5 TaxID=591445 RepID=A0AC34G1U2_9BILA
KNFTMSSSTAIVNVDDINGENDIETWKIKRLIK